jgi:small subunit ribosomal protein S8
MTMSDPLGDMLTRIRNGQHAKLKVVNCPASRLRASVLEVLKNEGYIRSYAQEQNNDGLPELRIELKYEEDQPVIREIHRVSKPGRRIYKKVAEMPRYYNGLGVTIVSTPQGVMSDNDARAKNVGGEVLCQIY